MSKTNKGLLAYAKAQIGLPYWWGTFGQTATAALYSSKKAQYPSYYTASDFSSQYGKRVHDCVGLIKGYLWSETTTSTPQYSSAQDVTAAGMYAKSTTKGTISSIPNKAGTLVYKGSSASAIYHIGVYGADGYIYEAKSHAYGVVKTAFKASEWQYWSQCPYTADDSNTTTTTETTQEEEEMTQAQFNEMYDAINPQYTAISQVPTWYQEEAQELKDLGVLKGDGTNEISIRLEGLQGAVIALRAAKAAKE